ncbi:MAG TPA: transposase [Phycisphaerae bacterium]|nr:transposase [Phycisphaerae bacterium]
MGPIKKRQGANLPHWTAEGATYFVTFRLGDSLPESVLENYREERQRLLAAAKTNTSSPPTAEDLLRIEALFSERIEKYLDTGAGACWMNRPNVADVVQSALLFFHETRYVLPAWAVMPNHVHVVVRPLEGFELRDILHSWKSFTSKEVNKLIGRTGNLWQAESWDHIVRDEDDFYRCVQYTLANPRQAGLREWRWVGRS